jgi:DNA-binding NarL/FixJ family response regulator
MDVRSVHPQEWRAVSTLRRPIAVAAVNDYEIIVHGLAAMLAPHRDHLVVRERFIIGEPVENGPIDVALFDTYGRVGIAERALETLTNDGQIRHVALFSLDFPGALVADARRFGVRSFISKTLPGDEVAAALVRTAMGKVVDETGPRRLRSDEARRWPGRDEGLTERESQALVLCAEGLTNREIAAALYVNVETVKSHLQRVYRKLGIRNRTEAARFVVDSGAFSRFQPTERLADGDGEVDEQPVEGPKR